MTDLKSKKSPRGSKWTAAHMLGFGLLLALIILLAKGPAVDREVGGRVAFTEADLAQIHAMFERMWNRPPTDVELRTAFERYVREEIFYREALAQGLDRNDPMVKMSLVRKITMLGTAQAQATEPTNAELKAYFELRSERYRIPASLSLQQVFLSPDKHGENIGTAAEELLAELREKDPQPEDLAGLGNMLMLPNVTKVMTEDQLADTFGTAFRDGVLPLAVGQWRGPVESAFGLHLVKVTQHEPSRYPDWTEMRDRILMDMRYEGRQAAEDQFYAEVLPRYQVVFDEGVTNVLEGSGNSAGQVMDSRSPTEP